MSKCRANLAEHRKKTTNQGKPEVENEKKNVCPAMGDIRKKKYSGPGKKKEINFEQIKNKITRRNNPEGEDKKQLAAIIRHLNETKLKLSVQDYVNLVSKFTTDNGETFRKIMEDDLISFRKLVTKIYENRTQDISDVLINEQIQAANYYQNKCDLLNAKLLQMINEIFEIVPNFDFDLYHEEMGNYLNVVLPLPGVDLQDTNIAGRMRQEAYHRLQWLKTEGNRLAEENRRLEIKLNELKHEQKEEQEKGQFKYRKMEEKLNELANEENEKQEKLAQLLAILDKSIVRNEALNRLEQEEKIRKSKIRKGEYSSLVRPHERTEWPLNTAVDMDRDAVRKLILAESRMAEDRKRARTPTNDFNPLLESRKMPQSKIPSPLNCAATHSQCPSWFTIPQVNRMQERIVDQMTSAVQEERVEGNYGNVEGMHFENYY